jgi:hypothetical protein
VTSVLGMNRIDFSIAYVHQVTGMQAIQEKVKLRLEVCMPC